MQFPFVGAKAGLDTADTLGAGLECDMRHMHVTGAGKESAMTCDALFDLAPRTLLPLHGEAGSTIRVLRGRVWITEEDDPRDVFLAAGSEHEIESGGTVLVEGLSLARVALESPRRSTHRPGVHGAAARWGALMRKWIGRRRPTSLSGAA